MNTELRERLGKVAFNANRLQDDTRWYYWETASEDVREDYRKEAEAVAVELATVALPALQGIVFAFTGKQVDMHLK